MQSNMETQNNIYIGMIWDEIMTLKRMVQKMRLNRKNVLPLTYDFWVKPILKTTSFKILMAKEWQQPSTLVFHKQIWF